MEGHVREGMALFFSTPGIQMLDLASFEERFQIQGRRCLRMHLPTEAGLTDLPAHPCGAEVVPNAAAILDPAVRANIPDPAPDTSEQPTAHDAVAPHLTSPPFWCLTAQSICKKQAAENTEVGIYG